MDAGDWWAIDLFIPVATAEFSKFANILSAALSLSLILRRVLDQSF